MHVNALMRIKQEFDTWLINKGFVVRANTSEWEVLRFKAADQMRIIYRNKYGNLTFTHDADVYLYSFLQETKPWMKDKRTKASLLDALGEPSDQRLWDSGVWS